MGDMSGSGMSVSIPADISISHPVAFSVAVEVVADEYGNEDAADHCEEADPPVCVPPAVVVRLSLVWSERFEVVSGFAGIAFWGCVVACGIGWAI